MGPGPADDGRGLRTGGLVRWRRLNGITLSEPLLDELPLPSEQGRCQLRPEEKYSSQARFTYRMVGSLGLSFGGVKPED